MFSTNKYQSFRPITPIKFHENHIYMVCHEQMNDSIGCMTRIENEQDIYRSEDGTVWGFAGFTYFDPVTKIRGEIAGVHVEDVIFDYSEFIRHHIAAAKIQAKWRAMRRKHAAAVIWRSWQRLKVKRQLWNPHTFVGIAHMMIEYVRTSREGQ